MTRLYVPATWRSLADLQREGFLVVGDDVVIAPDEDEDTEYDALMTAAETSAAWLADLGPGARRRVVVVAEVADVVEEAEAPGAPEAPIGRVRLTDVVAVHADPADVPPGSAPEELGDLAWYATQEIPDLLRA